MKIKNVLYAIAALALCLALLPNKALAFTGEVSKDQNQSGNVTVEKDRTINDNFFVAGSNVNIKGNVGKDLFGAGSNINLSGKVDKNAFLAAGQVYIDGAVGGDLYVGAGTVELTKDSTVEGDLVASGGTIKIDGKVNGKVYAGTGTLTFGPNAVIKSDIVYASNNKATIENGAQIGKITQKTTPMPTKTKIFIDSIWAKFFGLLSALLIGILLIIMFPKWMSNIATEIKENFWKSLGWGLLVLIGAPLLMILCMVLVIGLPLAFILLGIYIVLMYLAKIFVGLAVGKFILSDKATPVWSLILGLIILEILTLIPFVGGWISFIVVLLGLGAFVMSKYKMIKG